METQKFDFFFQNKLKLNFDLCQRAKIVQVGLNMHPYDDIGDASSSLRGSTSSSFFFFEHELIPLLVYSVFNNINAKI